MPAPTDRGYAVIYKDDSGTNLAVCTNLIDGGPYEAYAVHFRVRRLDIDKSIKFKRAGRILHTTQPVAVYGEPGVVHVRPSIPSADRSVATIP